MSVDPWMENLGEWILEDHRIVSAKMVSLELKVHVNVAKQRLFHFMTENKAKNLKAVYFLSGKDKSSGVRICKLALDTDLEKVERSMTDLRSKHVYALMSQECFKAMKNETGLYNAEMEVIKANPYLTTFSPIINKAAVPKADCAAKLLKVESEGPDKVMKPPTVKPKEEKKEEQRKPEEKVTSSKAGSSKGKANIASMFAKATTSKKVVKKTPVVEEKKKEELSPGKENKLNEEKEEAESTSTSESQAGSKRKGAELKLQPKRKRIQMMADSDSSEDEDEKEDEDAQNEEEEKPKASVISSEDEDDEVIPSTPQQSKQASPSKKASTKPGRRRVKKFENKTFLDDQGFMVTKREMVSASETESEDEEKDSSKKKAVLKEKEATNKPKPVVEEPNKEEEDGSGKKKKGSGSKAKKATAAVSPAKAKKAQPSIMNFFQKKST